MNNKNDSEVLDKIAESFLGEQAYENPTDALESIGMLISDTGRTIQGWENIG